ncbi:MAG TPA: hypothetical protein VLJ86_27110 [Ramlibacter sp.]|nr:hypothetical protein [Ramlibacter sp.]
MDFDALNALRHFIHTPTIGNRTRSALSRYPPAVLAALYDGDATGGLLELALAQLEAMNRPPSARGLAAVIELLPITWLRAEPRLLEVLCEHLQHAAHGDHRNDGELGVVVDWFHSMVDADADLAAVPSHWAGIFDAARRWHQRDREWIARQPLRWQTTLPGEHFGYYTVLPIREAAELVRMGDTISRKLWDAQLARRCQAGELELYSVAGPSVRDDAPTWVVSVERRGQQWVAGQVYCRDATLPQSICRLCHICAVRVDAQRKSAALQSQGLPSFRHWTARGA